MGKKIGRPKGLPHERLCTNCNIKFQRTHFRKDRDNFFCTVDCYRDFLRKGHGAKSARSYRAYALRHLDNRCVDCGMSFRPVLFVHHIDGNRENNELENLEILCANHHRMRHFKNVGGKWIFDGKVLTDIRLIHDINGMEDTRGRKF